MVTKREPKARPGTFGWVVFSVRSKLELTQPQLAAKSGVGQSRLSGIESGKKTEVHATTLFGICRVLQLDPMEALAGKIVYRRRFEDTLAADTHRLEVALSNGNHAKWIAYGHGLLASQPAGDDKPSERRTRSESKK